MENFKEQLKVKMDEFAHFIYKLTRNFPKQEIFGVTSQMRRAALSIILNYIEGYARLKKGSQLNFLEISYGSFKETKYLLHFSFVEGFLSESEYKKVIKLGEEIGAMLWTEIKSLKSSLIL